MNEAREVFEVRAKEIETYFSFIQSFIEESKQDDLNKILKSNLLLMLYNLVESSISNAIEEIHNDIHNRTVSFDLLKIELREVLIAHLKNHLNPRDFVTSIKDIAIDIVKKSFQKQKISNGNIDSLKIKKLGEQYGFNSNTNYLQTKNGMCLVDIKGRNDLAHGTFSFTEVGKDYSILDLEKMKNETINYLSQILENIDAYIVNQEYKQPAI